MTGDAFEADRMLKRARHMEQRAARARVGSNERRKLTENARALRAGAQVILQGLGEIGHKLADGETQR